MFQTTINDTKYNYDKLLSAFYKNTMNESSFESSDEEWDISKTYKPDHACIWNKIKAIGSECKILTKNERIALVVFKENKFNEDLMPRLYRLEDLYMVE